MATSGFPLVLPDPQTGALTVPPEIVRVTPVPVAVDGFDTTIERPSVAIETIVVPAGMPGPDTWLPTTQPARITFALRLSIVVVPECVLPVWVLSVKPE